MSELTLDDAIKHCLDIADGQDKCAEISVSEHAKERISQCATENRQLAEWLTELKEAKRLLKLAVEDFETIESNLEYDEHCVIKTHSIRCDECPLSADTIYRCKWRYAAEALALIGQDGDTNG